MDKLTRIRELTALLGKASKAYYQEDREIMSNYDYDRLYDELAALEQETGVVLAGSPTAEVGYEAVDELPKERHETPMLSLDKTKDVGALAEFAGEHEVLMSWKLDGLTVVLTYEQRRDRRGDHQQCQGVLQCALFHPLSFHSGFKGRGGDPVFGF